ncbi:Uncharacterized protein TCM_027162 [Theobroma cacao]|uniref:Epidermal patterning factor-like protein n=1 Tax=Theobroma cacao TaxID=3641 RepID=A0A061G9H2_THECC|nr:Uncharacterized protein TCM_027162 [Theobroma cacao]
MATSRICSNRLKVAITVTSIFFITFLYTSGDSIRKLFEFCFNNFFLFFFLVSRVERIIIYAAFAVGILNSGHSESMVQQSKMVLGSKPPSCVNKCLNCSPCMATLVIPSHQWKHFRATYHGDEDESYYLLSWKCKCGDKLFQP